MRNLSTSRLLFLIHTGGDNILKSPLVKHYNDLINKQSSERSRDEVTYFYVENVFYIFLGTKYANFQEKKIFAEISGKKFQTFHCSNVNTMENLELFSRNLREDFFLKIGILRAKVYTKNVPNIEECNFIPAPLRTLITKQVIEVLY